MRLERMLGDPWDGANPLGFEALVEADEHGRMSVAGEAVLDDFGLSAEFVPAGHGGRLVDLGRLVDVLRGVFRRDPCLGLGYGASSLLAALNVWVSGDAAQQRQVAATLLAHGKLACGYHELAHGNDIGGASCEATRADSGDTFVLNGVKQVVANISRAASVLVYARSEALVGARSHSLFLVDRATTAPGSIRDLPRYRSSGMRGIPLGGLQFDDCRIPASARVGAAGQGMETALKAFQISRIALPGMFAGIVDTGLRLTIRHARRRSLYGAPVVDQPLARTRLAEAFADLLACDAFCMVAANAARVVPAELSLHAAALKALVPGVLIGAMNGLAAVVGAHSYLREGEMAMFQKLLRDLQPVGFGHASRASCLMTILPQLPLVARRAWQSDAPAPAALFALDCEAGALSFDALSITTGGRDSLAPALRAFAREAPDPHLPAMTAWQARLAAEFDSLAERAALLRASDVTPDAAPESFALAGRYAVLLAATACIGLWRAQRNGGDDFLSRPAWVLAALHRLGTMLGDARSPLPEPLVDALHEELARRHDDGRGFDLLAHSLAPSPGWR
ncbi:hypothetical protein NCPPB3923_18470 [Burkholderia glumae]|nr:hypothetical protein NCPPB3923_18470 [Burkholderia glumae]